MKALAIAVVWASYTIMVYGLDKVRKGCTPLKTIAWPAGASGSGDISVACSSSSSSPASNSGSSLNNGGNATNLPGQGTTGGSGHPTTITVPSANVHITPAGAAAAGLPPQGPYRPGNPYHLPYPNLPVG